MKPLAIFLIGLTATSCSEDGNSSTFDRQGGSQDATVECMLADFDGTGEEERPAPDDNWTAHEGSDLEAVGGDGNQEISDAIAPSLGELDVGDLDLHNACSIQSEDARLWISTLTQAIGIEDSTIVSAFGSDDGRFKQHDTSPDGVQTTFLFFRNIHEYDVADREGRYSRFTDRGAVLSLEYEDGTPLSDATPDMGIPRSISYGHDGELLLGSDRIVVPYIGIVRDGSNIIEELIHGVGYGDGDPEEDSILGTVGHIETFPDGTVVFVIAARDAYEIWLTDMEGSVPEPLGGSRQVAERQRFDTLESLSDGRLLITADEEVQAVDLETGEIEVLVDLAGAAGPQSAAAVDDRLYVLAGGRLWQTDL